MPASSDLIWECVKHNNSFMRKSLNMPTMSAEVGNLCGMHSFKFSGVASKKVLDVSVKKTGQKETIVLTTRSKKSAKKGLAQVAKATGGAFYRRDLQELAEKKYAKVKTSLKKKKLVVRSRRAG